MLHTLNHLLVTESVLLRLHIYFVWEELKIVDILNILKTNIPKNFFFDNLPVGKYWRNTHMLI